MAFTPEDYQALHQELLNDPNALGLVAPPTIDDIGNTEKLNEVLDTQQIDREAIPISEIMVNIDRDEYVALADADRDWLNAISSGGIVNPQSGGEVREGILQLFGAETESRQNLVAILTEPANRIEQMHKQGLLSQGGSVTTSDVANARNATP